MRVVITGASGNVGSALVRRLRQEPSIDEIVGVCRRPPREGRLTGAGISWVAADVTTADLASVFAGADVLVHLAWLVQPARDPATLARTNVDGSRRAFDAAIRADVGSIVHSSSIAAYWTAPRRFRVDEHWPIEGLASSSYSRDKVAVERYLDQLEAEHPNVRVVRMRPCAIIQRDASSAIVAQFLGPFVPPGLFRRGVLPFLPLPRGTAVQALHADDAADGFARAALGDVRGAFNLAGEPVLDERKLAAVLKTKILHVPAGLLRALATVAWRLRLQPTDPEWLRLLQHAVLLDTTRARTELGWQPSRPADEALIELLDGLRSRAAGPTPLLQEGAA